MAESQRRLKMFYLSIREVVHFLNYAENAPEYLTIPTGPRIEGVPDGAHVVSVHNAPERRAFAIVVEHESFDLVNDSALIPATNECFQLDRRGYKLIPV